MPHQKKVKEPRKPLSGRDAASPSELFPFLSKLPAVLRKVYVLPVLVVLACVVLAFDGQARPLIWLLAVAITVVCFLFIYRIAGKRKSWWVLLLAGYGVFFFLGFPFRHSDPAGFTYRFSSKLRSGDIDLGSYLLAGSFVSPVYLPAGIEPGKLVHDLFDAKGNPLDPRVITAEMQKDAELDVVLYLLHIQGATVLDHDGKPLMSAAAFRSILEHKEMESGGPLLMVPLYEVLNAGERYIVFPMFGAIFLRSPKFLGFVSALFDAGLPEELLKSLPIFLLLFWGFSLRGPRRELRGVTEPLDGIILGAATGAGFALAENLFNYIPTVMFNQGGVSALGLILLRSFDELSGHVAYAGFFGYFIGLAAMRPRHRARTILIGYLVAATAHGLWDSSSVLSPMNPLILELSLALGSYLLLAAAVVKAREISPDQAVLKPSISLGFARRFARHPERSDAADLLLDGGAGVSMMSGHIESKGNSPQPFEEDRDRRAHREPLQGLRPGDGSSGGTVQGGDGVMDSWRYTVGRAKDCDLAIADDSVSRRHAEVWFLGSDRIRVRDLGSSNGTKLLRGQEEFVLGEETALPGDQICFGDAAIPARELIDALGALPAGNAAAPKEQAKLMRCVCGAIRPGTGKCPVCGE